MRLSPVPPNTPPLTRIFLWGLLAETLLPHVTRLVMQNQLLLLQRCLSLDEAANAGSNTSSSSSSGNNLETADAAAHQQQQQQQQQQSLLHAVGRVCPSDVSYSAAKAAAAAAAAAATAVAGALGQYLWTYKPHPSLLQALLGLAMHRKVPDISARLLFFRDRAGPFGPIF